MTDDGNGSRTPRTSRRALLSGLGAAGLGATAGCLTTLPAFGQRVRFGDVDEPTAGEPAYRDWLPDDLEASAPPGAVQLEFHRPGSRGEATVGAPYRDWWPKRRLEYLGVDFRSFEYVVVIGRTVVGRAALDRDRVAETLGTTGYEATGAHEGFDLYRRADPADGREATAAVDADRGLIAFAGSGPDAVTEIVDTGVGRRTRRRDTAEAFARLAEELGGYPVTTFSRGRAGEDREVAAVGTGYAFDDDGAYHVRTRVYADGDDISRRELERELENWPPALEATRVDLRIDEPVVTAVAQFDHESFADAFGPPFAYPLITWRFEYDADAGELLLTHRAGEAVDASLFTLKDAQADEPTDEQFTDLGETIGPGDSLRVDADDGAEWHVRLDGTVPGTDETWTEFNVGSRWFDR